jgi:hypothetical protein
MPLRRAKAPLMAASEGIYFQMLEPTQRRHLTCVATRIVLQELAGRPLPLPDLLPAFTTHRTRLERLASRVFDDCVPPPRSIVTVGLREVREAFARKSTGSGMRRSGHRSAWRRSDRSIRQQRP